MGDVFAMIIAFLTNNWIDILGYMSTVFSVAGALMSTMIPLRIAAILNSIVAIIYAIYTSTYPVLVTEMILLPINTYRLYEMMQLIKKSRAAATGGLSMDWLLPFATSRRSRPGMFCLIKGMKQKRCCSRKQVCSACGRAALMFPPAGWWVSLGLSHPTIAARRRSNAWRMVR
jgi:hypothetical protein